MRRTILKTSAMSFVMASKRGSTTFTPPPVLYILPERFDEGDGSAQLTSSLGVASRFQFSAAKDRLKAGNKLIKQHV